MNSIHIFSCFSDLYVYMFSNVYLISFAGLYFFHMRERTFICGTVLSYEGLYFFDEINLANPMYFPDVFEFRRGRIDTSVK